MLIAAIVSGIIVLFLAPTIYFMIVKRSKSSDHDVYHINRNENIDQTPVNPSQQNSPPEVISGNDENPESNVTIEIIPEAKHPRDHFK
ncbi:MAG: hypothetical protein IPJ75_15330 [Ignavibacteriales bacterium]|nr:hypothetical protein [Ignavibacteriales bacterium]